MDTAGIYRRWMCSHMGPPKEPPKGTATKHCDVRRKAPREAQPVDVPWHAVVVWSARGAVNQRGVAGKIHQALRIVE